MGPPALRVRDASGPNVARAATSDTRPAARGRDASCRQLRRPQRRMKVCARPVSCRTQVCRGPRSHRLLRCRSFQLFSPASLASPALWPLRPHWPRWPRRRQRLVCSNCLASVVGSDSTALNPCLLTLLSLSLCGDVCLAPRALAPDRPRPHLSSGSFACRVRGQPSW